MKRNNIANKIKNSLSKLGEITSLYVEGTVFSVSGLVTEITGMADHVLPGDAIVIASRNGPPARGEVVGFNGKVTQYGELNARANAVAHALRDLLGA